MKVIVTLRETVERLTTVTIEVPEAADVYESGVKDSIIEFANECGDWDDEGDGVEIDSLVSVDPKLPEADVFTIDGFLVMKRGTFEITDDEVAYDAYLKRRYKGRKKPVPVLPGQMRLPNTEKKT